MTRSLNLTQLLRDLNAFAISELRVNLEVKSDDGTVVEVRGDVVDRRGSRAGDVTRRYVCRNGRWEAIHTGLYLESRFQGRGFGRGFHRHSESVYRKHGISQISLFAQQKGAYAWQSEGFTLAGLPERRRQQCVEIWDKWGGQERATEALRDGHIDQPDFEAAAREFARVADGERSPMEPNEIAQFGAHKRWRDEDGHELWLGRAILTDSQWVGVKQI